MKVAPAFANFAQATDAAAMLDFFARKRDRFLSADEEVHEVQIPRVFPSGEERLTIQYRLRIANRKTGAERPLILCGELQLGTASGGNGHLRHPDKYLAAPDLHLSIPIYPFDRKLPALALLASLEQCADYFTKRRSEFHWGRTTPEIRDVQVLGYRAERRAVLRISIQRPGSPTAADHVCALIARIVRVEKLAAAIAIQQQIASGLDRAVGVARFSAPKIEYVDSANSVYFMEEIEGDNLAERANHPTFVEGSRHAGELLAVLHSLSPSDRSEFTATQELSELETKVHLVTAIFPELREACRRELMHLTESLAEVNIGTSTTLIHRDFYDKQVLISNDRVVLIDFDGVAAGDPAQDYGNFLAHCFLRQLQQSENSALIAAGAKAFILGYGRQSSVWLRRAAWWQSSTLLRLAVLYALRPRWRSLSYELINECGRILSRMNSKTRIVNAQTE